LYLDEVEVKKLRLISQRGFGGYLPQEQTRSEKKEGRKVFEKKVIWPSKVYKYEATDIGHTYDSLYWSWVRMIGSYREKEEEANMEDKVKEAAAIIKG
jgi:hypothetical protein